MTIHGFQLTASHSPQKFALVKPKRLNITTQTTKTLQNWQKAIYKRQGTKKALQPRVRWENWTNQEGYDSAAAKLKTMFVDNFQQFSSINEKVDGVYNSLKNDQRF